MRFWKVVACRLWIGVVALILLHRVAIAGPLFPDVRASGSMNGKFLVVVEETYDALSPAGARRVVRRTYAVLQSEPFSNNRDRLQTAIPFWSSSGWQCWQVTPAGAASRRIYLPMISNDGKTLVLILVSPPMGDQEVVRIYHREGDSAKLIRALQLSDFWTADEIKAYGDRVATDETPMWYADAKMEFSSDDQELLYRGRWNDKVQIRLADGATLSRH
jgi:hypothetical protein